MIRLATRADVDDIVLGYDALFDYEEVHGCFSNWRRGVYPLRSDVEAALAAGTLYVLREEGALCASAILNRVQPAEYAAAAWRIPAGGDEALVVHTLCVPPAQSHRGAARKMLRFAAELARRTGCRALRLDTWLNNRPAAMLYASEGFHAIGVTEALDRGHGEDPWPMLLFERDPWDGLPLSQFDPTPAAVINPADTVSPVPGCPRTVVACFAHNLIAGAVERYGAQFVFDSECANGPVPLYRVEIDGETIGLTMVAVGAPLAVGQFDELFAAGVERILAFGTCGVLDGSIGDCAVIVPDRAVRDEGTSFHYAPPSAEIAANVGTLDLLTGFFAEQGVPLTVGKTWTTDAFYRETRARAGRRREEGCVCVDQECSAFAALAQFRQKQIAQFFYAADNLDAEAWDARSLDNAEALDAKERLVGQALRLGARWERRAREAERANALLERIAADFRGVLGDGLVGFYVHGSLAFGCFRWDAGDLDFLAVVNRPLAFDERRALIRVLLDRTPEAPLKGIEMSVVTEAAMRDFRHPSPFELHFSPAHLGAIRAGLDAYCRDAAGVDPDLAAHLAAARTCSRAIIGDPARDAFPPVPKEAVLDSIRYDVLDESADPLYAALNLCRALAYLAEGRMLSKCGGAVWALRHLPDADRPVVRQALAGYLSGAEVDTEALAALCQRLRRHFRDAAD